MVNDLYPENMADTASVRPDKSREYSWDQIGYHPFERQGITRRRNIDKQVQLQRGRQFSRCPVHRSLTPTVMSSIPLHGTSLDPELYTIFETRPPYEEHRASREELFKTHGYKFRPRLRKDWVPGVPPTRTHCTVKMARFQRHY